MTATDSRTDGHVAPAPQAVEGMGRASRSRPGKSQPGLTALRTVPSCSGAYTDPRHLDDRRIPAYGPPVRLLLVPLLALATLAPGCLEDSGSFYAGTTRARSRRRR